jgi:HD superfamily phosphohydrolase
MFDIVANKTNSIDVDKFDYIQRDSYNLGLNNISFDHERIFTTSRVIQN